MSSPGSDMQFEDMVKNNVWHRREELQAVIDVLRLLFTPNPEGYWKSISGWSWSKNPGWRAKYVNIMIDMRDGGFILQDRDGNRISLEQIQAQRVES